MTEPHPYYDSKKRQNHERYFLRVFLPVVLVGLALIFITAKYIHIKYKPEPIWIPYEVKVLTRDKVILYRSDDVSDSIVFRCDTRPFLGIQAIEKLEMTTP